MSTDAEKLLLAVISQLEVTKLDYERLARDIGIPSSEAARLRWFRLKNKLKQSAGTSPSASLSKPSGIQKTKSTPRGSTMGAQIKSKSRKGGTGDGPGNDVVVSVTPPPKRLPFWQTRAKGFKQILEISDSEIDEGLMEYMQKTEKKEKKDDGWK